MSLPSVMSQRAAEELLSPDLSKWNEGFKKRIFPFNFHPLGRLYGKRWNKGYVWLLLSLNLGLIEKRERPENGSMRVPKMGECFCFLFWADMHYFAAMRNSMEEETVSLISNGETSVVEEFSDSNSSTHPFPASKRARSGSNISASKFKGVVPLPNGHWGCQIYANHQRIWLGTFKSEKEAAMAYDSAALKLRSGDSRRNTPLTDVTVEEPKFQSYFSTEVVLNMIKDGTYQCKFANFIRTCSQSTVETELSLKLMMPQSNQGLTCKQLFQKELTPSDVGKLNRIVIPKKYAIKYFPRISESAEEVEAADKMDGVMLAFHDKSMKLWKFRYCYWKSSQSYVFTRGWNRFVKEKKLKANDTISFSLCERGETVDSAAQTFYMIDVNNRENSGGTAELSSQSIASKVELQLRIDRDSTVRKKERMRGANKRTQNAEKTGFKLFGIQII
ncbi:AP2/ERF and B3 domain-containing transcription factor [Populus alba x Populus x berolinensis]|uniref:AP2/ERF and B3 domain-containing transcription factor n=1 Tax=Populus alba x Populus x berolinensis TaxID=444605 RepID=A0AAD6LCN0_9ROSI|nr:AP2/ERF and B3 domain-containing transcription factor [Populus alba x Populus x berolinensis]